ncbi:MAG: heavy-metal-associated domain-containing protein [Candidatus Promineifilaceae bacterium]|nr:heavy-metal-associated domain-containing protein [Candidatus Promineifilaceae bacterium]
MEVLTLELPSMYGDHHVAEVRRLLLALSGVQDLYASSAFRAVEVHYEADRLDAEQIKVTLEEAGYLGELPVPEETGAVSELKNGDKPFFRHTVAAAEANKSVSFRQKVPYAGRPLWPCPGMGPLSSLDVEVEHG